MDEEVLGALRDRASEICTRWEALLRTESANMPLVAPVALRYLIPRYVEEIMELTAATKQEPSPEAARQLPKPACPCGRNPYLAFFVAGEQAMIEMLLLVQTDSELRARDADLAALQTAVRRMATREMAAFCTVCAWRSSDNACRFSRTNRSGATRASGVPWPSRPRRK